ncbi:MAG TPA: RodZ domain-containing protein [Burkholderiales bacterium]|nr:RodZ domain-containing protein [Burkholderiales bacterium]
MNDAAANAQPAATAVSGPGAVLLAERRRQNLSLGDVSRQLKLSVRQVEALERDDFSGFQGPVFVHGFIRNYSKLLGLESAPLIRSADQLLNPAPVHVAPDPAVIREKEDAAAAKPKWPLIAGVAIVVLVAGLMLVNNRGEPTPEQAPEPTVSEQIAAAPVEAEKNQPSARQAEKAVERPVAEKPGKDRTVPEKTAPEKTPPEKSAEPAAAVEKPAQKPATPTQEGLANPGAGAEAAETGPRMVIRMIFEQDSWVEIKDRNGNTVFGQLNAAGSRRSASGEPPLSIVVGNAAGVRLFQGEKSVDLAPHTRVDVARLILE